MLIYDDFSEKCHVTLKKFLLLLWKIFKLLSMCAKFHVNKWQFSIQKKLFIISLPPPVSDHEVKIHSGNNINWTSEPFDSLNYKPFFYHSCLETISHVSLLFIFVWNKISCSTNWAVFKIFLIWFSLTFSVTEVLCFWCPCYKIVGT